MGSGSSTASAGIEIVSPRVEMTKNGPKDVILDSLALSDVGHGTIHYRYQTPGPSVHDPPGQKKSSAPTGYFFHQKLKDYSELGDPANEEAHKFVKVASGPRRHENKKIYYVSGLGFSGTNQEIPPALGKNAKQSKKIYGHKYFVVTCDTEEGMDAGSTDEIIPFDETGVKMLAAPSDTVKDVKRRLGRHFLCPLAIVHVLADLENELSDEHLVRDLLKGDIAGDSVTLILSLQ